MKTIAALSGLVLLLLATGFAVRADIARPKPTPKTDHHDLFSSLEIIPDPKATDAILQIPKSDMKVLSAALDGMPTNSSFAASIAHSSTRTIIAGVLLFVSVSFAGVWLARASRSKAGLGRGQKTVAVLLITVATLGAATIITRGNAGPPPAYSWRNLAAALADGKSTKGPILIQVVDDQNSSSGVKLIIPLKKQTAQGE